MGEGSAEVEHVVSEEGYGRLVHSGVFFGYGQCLCRYVASLYRGLRKLLAQCDGDAAASGAKVQYAWVLRGMLADNPIYQFCRLGTRYEYR